MAKPLYVLEFFAVGNKELAVLFYSVKGGVFGQFLTTNMKYLLFVKLCITVELRMQHSAYFVNMVCACVVRDAVA